MHMADALVSPTVGIAMIAVSGGLITYCASKLKKQMDEHIIPLMGVLGAFIFAAQMINFTIPATGSSGHIGGGMILAILLGPYAGFLAIASVLIVQSLFFADGGLLALGCNIFNLGFFPCFIAYPLIYRKIAGDKASQRLIIIASVTACIVALQMGAFGVVLETTFSGISELPLKTFAMLMQPIHLAIGLAEGLITFTILIFVRNARPEILNSKHASLPREQHSLRKVIITLIAATIFTGTILSWFASSNPDGLEWAISKTANTEELDAPNDGPHKTLTDLQKETAFLPDYAFRKNPQDGTISTTETWPAIDNATSIAGLTGGFLTMLLAFIIGFTLKRRSFANAERTSQPR